MRRPTIPVLLAIALAGGNAGAGEEDRDAERPMSIAELKQRLAAPRIFTVAAYVVAKYDRCPPCPPKAVCETCELGIYIADGNRQPEAGAAKPDGIYLRTREAARFKVGARYVFTLRYRTELNRAGAWLQTGPALVGFSPVDSQAEPR